MSTKPHTRRVWPEGIDPNELQGWYVNDPNHNGPIPRFENWYERDAEGLIPLANLAEFANWLKRNRHKIVPWEMANVQKLLEKRRGGERLKQRHLDANRKQIEAALHHAHEWFQHFTGEPLTIPDGITTAQQAENHFRELEQMTRSRLAGNRKAERRGKGSEQQAEATEEEVGWIEANIPKPPRTLSQKIVEALDGKGGLSFDQLRDKVWGTPVTKRETVMKAVYRTKQWLERLKAPYRVLRPSESKKGLFKLVDKKDK